MSKSIETSDYNGKDRREVTARKLLWWIMGSLFFCLVTIVSLLASSVNDRICRVESVAHRVPAVMECLKGIDSRLERIERLLDRRIP